MAKKRRKKRTPRTARENWWIIVVLVIFLITLVLIVHRTDTLLTKDFSKLPKSGPFEEWKSCGGDIDCVETQKGCCSCEMGGAQAVVNRQYLGEWKALIEKDCKKMTACDSVYNCKEGKPVCDFGRCIFEKEI